MDYTYLDYASLWPLRQAAATAMTHARDLGLGDPTRPHRPGRAAAELLERATTTAAQIVGANAEQLVWTSGGTEAIHHAIHGTVRAAMRTRTTRNTIAYSAVEHSSVIRGVAAASEAHTLEPQPLPVDRAGRVDVEAACALINDQTLIVHLQHANHEVGTYQPIHEIAEHAHKVGALVHVDACQTVGQVGFTLDELGADLVSGSAAKFGGPPGVGFLALGPEIRVDAIFAGDERQRRRRSGLLDTAAIAGAAVALREANDQMQAEFSTREVLRRHLRARIADSCEDLAIHGPLADTHPGIVAVSALYVDGAALQVELDRAGFAVHSGSSCAATSGEPSHVLVAMEALTHGHVRVSFGPEITQHDLDRFVDAFAHTVSELRGLRSRPS